MSASFFDRLRAPGTKPIAPQGKVFKTGNENSTSSIEKDSVTAPKDDRPSPTPSERSKKLPHPRRVQSTVTLAVQDSRPVSAPKRSSAESIRPRANLKRPSPTHLKPPEPSRPGRLESSDEESSADERETKRSRMGSASPLAAQVVDPARRFVHPISFRSRDPKTGKPLERCQFKDSEIIANDGLPSWSRRREFKSKGTDFSLRVGLHYPGIADQEAYQLVEHTDADEHNPVVEIFESMELVATYLLPPELARDVHSNASGTLVYRMRRGLKEGDRDKFFENLKAYNQLVRRARRDGTFKRRIASMTYIPSPLVEHILGQSYARTVALRVDELKDYQAFTNEVYGELLPKLTSKMFKEANLTSDKVFVDLGSGTGNVVMHAALECGCESWGCEKMGKPAALAEAQRREFIARCRMWGLAHGEVHLEHDTFLENRNIATVLRRADVLLVNNFAFEPDLNQKLLDMFLDLKEGAIVFSLKPFVPANHVITTRNAESPVNRLRMVERLYFSREVSWTDSGGKYYVHTVDSSMLRKWMAKDQGRRQQASE